MGNFGAGLRPLALFGTAKIARFDYRSALV